MFRLQLQQPTHFQSGGAYLCHSFIVYLLKRRWLMKSHSFKNLLNILELWAYYISKVFTFIKMSSERIDKILFFLEQHPYDGQLITEDNIYPSLSNYLNPALVTFRFQQTNIMEEQFVQPKLREIYRISPLQNIQPANAIRQFLCRWVSNDDKLKIDYQEFDQMVLQIIEEGMEQIQQKVMKIVGKQQEQTSHKRIERLKHQRHHEEKQVPQNVFKQRLRVLYRIYIKKEHKLRKQMTFDDLGTSYQQMSLTTWMIFNKDNNIIALLSKEQTHSQFKKYKEKHINFQQFVQSITSLILKIHPESIQNGWKMLSIFDQESFQKKLLSLGTVLPLHRQTPHLKQNTLPKSSSVKAQYKTSALPNICTVNSTKPPMKAFPSNLKNKQLSKYQQELSALNIDKLSRLKMDVPIEVVKDDEDDIFLKQYKLEQIRQSGQTYANKMKKQHKKSQLQSDKGILKRIDDRINKYAKS